MKKSSMSRRGKPISRWKQRRRLAEKIELESLFQQKLCNARLKFVTLICSEASTSSQLGKSLSHLASTLDGLLTHLPSPYGSAKSLSTLFGPFIARSILEVSLTAIVSRVDPFRVLTIGKSQTHTSYDASVAASTAFRWQGDVMAEEKPAGDLWNAKVKIAEASRAILGQYQDALFWQPAFEKFLDFSSEITNSGDWTADLKNMGLASFIPRLKTIAASVYSKSSKGVHHEYVLPPATYFDPASMQDLLDDTLKLVLSLAVVANFGDYYFSNLRGDIAYEYFESLQT